MRALFQNPSSRRSKQHFIAASSLLTPARAPAQSPRIMTLCPEQSGNWLSEAQSQLCLQRERKPGHLALMPALSCPQERGQRGGTGRTWGWLGPALVFFPLGGLACLLPLRRPPEASGLESQVTRPPPRQPVVPWGLAQLPPIFPCRSEAEICSQTIRHSYLPRQRTRQSPTGLSA